MHRKEKNEVRTNRNVDYVLRALEKQLAAKKIKLATVIKEHQNSMVTTPNEDQ